MDVPVRDAGVAQRGEQIDAGRQEPAEGGSRGGQRRQGVGERLPDDLLERQDRGIDGLGRVEHARHRAHGQAAQDRGLAHGEPAGGLFLHAIAQVVDAAPVFHAAVHGQQAAGDDRPGWMPQRQRAAQVDVVTALRREKQPAGGRHVADRTDAREMPPQLRSKTVRL